MNLPTVLFAPDKHTCVFAYVDARERKEYDESHIIVARHAPICVCSKLLYVATASMIDMQELTGQFTTFADIDLPMIVHVVVYDSKTVSAVEESELSNDHNH